MYILLDFVLSNKNIIIKKVQNMLLTIAVNGENTEAVAAADGIGDP